MKHIKLFELLSKLSTEEWKGFYRYVQNWYSRKNTLPVITLEFLERFYPEFDDEKLSKEKIFRKIFPKKAYNDNKINKLFSEITRLYEEYIIREISPFSIAEQALQLSAFYLNRSIFRHFLSNQKELLKVIQALPEGTEKNLLKYRFEEMCLHYQIKSNERLNDYQLVYDSLNDFFSAEKLRWNNLSRIDKARNLEDNHSDNLFYLTHLQLHQLIETGHESDYKQLFEWSVLNLKGFDKEQSREILGILKDYCVRKVNAGSTSYYHQLIDIYHLYIDLDILLESDQYIKTSTFKNYITCCLKIGKLDEADLFLEKYNVYIDPEFVEDVYQFNKANILFEKQKFSDVLTILNTAMFNDIFYKINTRRLLIKTYYELFLKDNSYYDIFESAINAFRKFIYTNEELSNVYIDANKNFIKLCLKLPRISIRTRQSHKMSEQIAQCLHLAERDWLLKHT